MATIKGTSGNDSLLGTDGDDSIIPGLGNDIVDGGAGVDTLVVDYTTSNGRISYDFNNYGNPVTGSGKFYSGSNSAQFTKIESYNITGSQFNDDIFGGNYNDILNGGDGNDYIDSGAGGVDVLDGGAGTDTLRRDLSAVTTGTTVDNEGTVINFFGGTVAKNFENINVTLGSGNDIIKTGLGNDIVDGGAGIDTLVVDYTTSNGRISYDFNNYGNPVTGSGKFYSGSNSAQFTKIESYNITGSQFNDDIFGGNYNDILNGGDGNDYIDSGAGGVDVLDGGAGTDTLRRDLSAVTTGTTVDNEGTVINFFGGTVAKNFENINVTLGSGNDIIKTGLGNDIVDGGAGIDTLVVDYTTSNGRISYDFNNYGNPVTGSGKFYSGSNSAQFTKIESYNITGSQFNDDIFGGNYNDILNGGDGNDYIDSGAGGVDVLDGGAGTDTLRRDLSAVTTGTTVDNEGTVINFFGGTVAKNFENINVTLGSGNDIIKTGLGNDIVDGGAGIDTLVVDYTTSNGRISYDFNNYGNPVTGSGKFYSGSNSAQFTKIESYNITGSQFNDDIFGGNYNDILNGGDGDDYIDTGGGNDILISVNSNSSSPGLGERDTLKGGLGADRFILGDGVWSAYDDSNSTTFGTNDYVLITDFNPSEDVIQLKGLKSDYILAASPISGISGTGIFINKPGSEPDELIAVLQNVSSLNINSSAFVAISTTQKLAFSAANFFVSEDGTPFLPITVTRTGNLNGTVSATVNLSNGSATSPDDYNNASIAVNFASGETAKTVTIPIVNDTLFEGNETIKLSLTLTNPPAGATLGTQSTAILTIADNDIPTGTLAFSAANFSVNENGTPVTAVTINRTGSSIGTTSAIINFLLGGTATPTTDYNSTPVVVNFANGQTSQTVTIPIVNDTLFESNETISLVLTNPSNGATIGTLSTATLTIINDDPLNGTVNNDTLTGSNNNDVINGLAGNDIINGFAGNDVINGGDGNDSLLGGDGNDILTGAGSGNGVKFIDTLTGGNGLDSFILSNATTVFYNDGNNSIAGLSDYALIKDFNSSQDKIQLEGAASRYLLGSSPVSGISGTAIYLDTNNNQAFNSTDELIAVVQGSTGLNLTASYFAYV